MPISVVCLSCFAKLRAPDNMAGRTMKCPKCGRAVVVPSPVNEAAQPTPAEPPPLPVKRVEPAAVRPVPPPPITAAPFGLVEQPYRMPTSPASPIAALDYLQDDRPRREHRRLRDDRDSPAQESKTVHSLGIASIVVGVVALPFSLFPCIGVLFLPLSGLGILLGVIGGIVSLTRRGRGIGFPIAGTAISGMAALFGIFWLGLLSAAHRTTERLGRELERPERIVGEEKATGTDSKTPPKTVKPDRPPEPSWSPSDNAVRHGDLQVKIASASIGKVALKDVIREAAVSEKEFLIVKLELLNLNTTKKVEYYTWSGKDISFDRDYATLKDDFGNGYKRIGFGFGSYPIGAVEKYASVHPFKTLTEVLVFEVPIATATYVVLELPAKNYGAEGVIRFRIPMTSVQGSDAAAKAEAEVAATRRAEDLARRREEARRLTEAEATKKAELDAAEARRKADLEMVEAKKKAELDKAERAAALVLLDAMKMFADKATREKVKKALEEIASKFPGTKAASEARELLAAPLLREAKKLLAGKGTVENGRKGLREVVRLFPDTATATEARRLLKLEAAKERHDKNAAPHLRAAWKLYDQGLLEKAREGLTEMLKEYPTSKTTEDARKLLEKIDWELELKKKPDK